MLKFTGATLAVLSLLGCGAIASETAFAGGSAPASCIIKTDNHSDAVNLTAFANAAAPVSGSYEFDIDKRGAGGDSSVAQAGDFNLRPGRESSLGDVTLSRDPGTHYVARMTLTWNGGGTSCVART